MDIHRKSLPLETHPNTVTNVHTHTSVTIVGPFGWRRPPYEVEREQRIPWWPGGRGPQVGPIPYTPSPLVEQRSEDELSEGEVCTFSEPPDAPARQETKERPPTYPLLCEWADNGPP